MGRPRVCCPALEDIKSVGKLSDFGDIDIVGVGHGEPIPEGVIEILKSLREQKV